MARPGQPENRAIRSFRQLRRFHHDINSDKVFGTHNGFVEMKFKAVAGSQDRAAGIVWRAKDANNYYVVRANALEDNVVLYKTVNGVRSSLDIVGRKTVMELT
jgi:hypothetical protein